MSSRQPTRMLLSIAAIGSVLTSAGCGGGLHRDENRDETTGRPAPPSTTTTASDTAGPDALPNGFPPEVPVVGGHIDSKFTEVPGSSGGKVWILAVTGIDADSYDKAEQLVLDAGFARDEQAPELPQGKCDRQSHFSNDAPGGGGYVVHLCASQTEPAGYRLEYSVNAYPKADWQPPDQPAPRPGR